MIALLAQSDNPKLFLHMVRLSRRGCGVLTARRQTEEEFASRTAKVRDSTLAHTLSFGIGTSLSVSLCCECGY
jgi:hypothetical protein